MDTLPVEMPRSYRSAIEAVGQANPSLSTVDRVALALLENEAAGAEAEGPLVWEALDGSTALLLGVTDTPRAELRRWTLAPGGRYDAEPDRPGAQGFHHVLAGRLTPVLETGP